jgi:hypothetical protein
MSYLWVNKENCQLYFGKGLNGAQILKFLHILKIFANFIFHLIFTCLMCFFFRLIMSGASDYGFRVKIDCNKLVLEKFLVDLQAAPCITLYSNSRKDCLTIVWISDWSIPMANTFVFPVILMQDLFFQDTLPIQWMSPESIKHDTYNYRTDIWSYGVLLWEIVHFGKFRGLGLINGLIWIYNVKPVSGKFLVLGLINRLIWIYNVKPVSGKFLGFGLINRLIWIYNVKPVSGKFLGLGLINRLIWVYNVKPVLAFTHNTSCISYVVTKTIDDKLYLIETSKNMGGNSGALEG